MSEPSFFEKLGSVVGVGVGSIDVLLMNPAARWGETVHGRVMLKLARKTEAARLVVGVEATSERQVLVSDGRGGRSRSTETTTVHKFEQQLDGKRHYLDEGYDLHLPLPAAPAKVELPDGVLGDVARFVRAVAGSGAPSLRWRVYAFLDVPWKANIRGAADLIVR